MSNNRLQTKCYLAWTSMRARCTNPKATSYDDYGGRGIRIDRSWDKYENFREDMGLPPSEEHQLDRINNDGSYNANNCRWATREQQQNNRRANVFVTIGEETKSVRQWSRDPRCHVHYVTIFGRLRRGWSPREAIFTGSRHGRPIIRAKKNIYVNINGQEKTVLAWTKEEWCKTPYQTIMSRIKRGIHPRDALLKGLNCV